MRSKYENLNYRNSHDKFIQPVKYFVSTSTCGCGIDLRMGKISIHDYELASLPHQECDYHIRQTLPCWYGKKEGTNGPPGPLRHLCNHWMIKCGSGKPLPRKPSNFILSPLRFTPILLYVALSPHYSVQPMPPGATDFICKTIRCVSPR